MLLHAARDGRGVKEGQQEDTCTSSSFNPIGRGEGFKMQEALVFQVISGVLIVTNVGMLLCFLRARNLVKKTHAKEPQIQRWLKVHESLESAGHAVIEIRKMNVDAIFYRQPTR